MKFFTAALVATAANAIQLEAEAQSSHVSAALREVQWGIYDAQSTITNTLGALDGAKANIDALLGGDIVLALDIIEKGWSDADKLIFDDISPMGYGDL